MKYLLAVVLLLAAGPAVAQQRSAAGSIGTELTWSALTDQINALKAQTNGVNIRIDQVIVCGKKGMLYATGAGADAQGCVSTPADAPPTFIASINTNATNIQRVAANVNSIVACSQSGGTIALSGSSIVCNPAVNPIAASFKAEVASFTETASPATNYCATKGYDALLSSDTLTTTHHCGGSSGGDCTYVTGYTLKCIRAVRR